MGFNSNFQLFAELLLRLLQCGKSTLSPAEPSTEGMPDAYGTILQMQSLRLSPCNLDSGCYILRGSHNKCLRPLTVPQRAEDCDMLTPPPLGSSPPFK